MTSTIAVLTAIILSVVQLANEPSRLTIQHGDVVTEIGSSLFIDSSWVEREILQEDLDGATISIVTFEWPGNGACLAVFKAVDAGFRLLGDFTNLFGGNGIELSVSNISVTNGELLFEVEWTGHLRGYFPNQDDPQSYVPPEDVTSAFTMATDGDSLWMIGPASIK